MESRPAVAASRADSASPLVAAWARIRTSPGWIVAIALLLRAGWIVIGHTYKFKSTDDNFGFGWEMGRIGASLASGHGFSSPFGPATGPTAWEPPLYPYLTAGVFLVFGIYSKASAIVLLMLNSVFSYKFKSTDDNFGFGWEMGRIGASLASGHGFSSPFGPATGPKGLL